MAQYALVIGITQNHSSLKTLEKSAADAQAIADVLREYGKFDYIELLLKPQETTYKALEAKILEFLSERAVGQEALIYYSGHGFQSKVFGTNEVFLAPSDCVVELDADEQVVTHDRGLPLTSLSKSVAGANLSSLVMLLDCCNSGYLLEESLLQQTFGTFKSKDYSVFMACRSFEKAWAKKNDPHSVFTGAVLAGLRQDQADNQGEINTDTLFGFIQKTLRNERQEVVRLFIGRSIVLVRYPVPTPLPMTDDTNPYQSLSAFTPATAKFFFGREPEIQKLVQQVQNCNFVPVIGASGSGKSSLVSAGLIPRLRELDWEVLEMKPGKNPLAALKSTIGTLVEEEWEEIYRILEEPQGLGSIVSRLPGAERILLVVDQFEEVFTLCPDTDRQQFIDCLTSVKQSENRRLVVVTTMRVDFVDHWLTSGVLTQAIQADALWLGVLEGEHLEDAIEKPAKIQGYTLDSRLLMQILRDVEKEVNCLPLLEFALTELWEKRDRSNQLLTLTEYEGLGGLVGALDHHADRIYQTLAASGQGEWVRRVMLELVLIGNGMPQDTRQRRFKTDLLNMGGAASGQIEWVRRVILELVLIGNGMPQDTQQRRSRADLLNMGGDDLKTRQDIEDTIDRLVDARLLVSDRVDDQNVIDLSHEALMQKWARFVEWRKSDRENRRSRDKIKNASKEWQDQNRQSQYLLERRLLRDAVWLMKERSELLSNEIESFIIKSCLWRLAYSTRLWVLVGLGLTVALIENTVREHRVNQDIQLIQTTEDKNQKKLALLNLAGGCYSGIQYPLLHKYFRDRIFGNCRPLHSSNLSNISLTGANLRDSNLDAVNLSHAYLKGANLSSASLIGTNFDHANLDFANLSRTNLNNANLRCASLMGTNLSGASLEGVQWDEKTNWDGISGWNTVKNIPPELEKQLNFSNAIELIFD
jgi:energy-coupling factor transporter ATP-binding protein EcfA2